MLERRGGLKMLRGRSIAGRGRTAMCRVTSMRSLISGALSGRVTWSKQHAQALSQVSTEVAWSAVILCGEAAWRTEILSHAEQLEGTTAKQNIRTLSSKAAIRLRVPMLPGTLLGYRSHKPQSSE